MSINRNELRLGSWVNLVIDGKIVKRVQICCLDAEGDLVKGGGESDALQPIPITEALLLKFGFKKYDGPAAGFYSEWQHIEWNTFFVGRCGPKSWSTSMAPWGRPIDHLHQLQNLFQAVTGKELQLQTQNT